MLGAFFGTFEPLFVDCSESGREVMLQLQEKEGFDFLEEIWSFTCGLVGFPIPQCAKGVGGSEQVEEISRTRPWRSQDNDGIPDGREGAGFQALRDLIVVEQDLLKEIFNYLLAEAVEVCGVVDAIQKKLSVLPRDGIEMFTVSQVIE